MFTGLIETTGIITGIRGDNKKKSIWITGHGSFEPPLPGGSVAVDGACQTVTDTKNSSFEIDALEQTLLKTTFSEYKPGRIVNLEKALKASDPLGGHFVQGHVNGTGRISEIITSGKNIYLEISSDRNITDYCIAEGSISIDGISFTIAQLKEGIVTVNVIPETWKRTSLSLKKKKDKVNIETDIIGRYLYTWFVKYSRSSNPLTREKLEKMGY